MHSFIKTPVHLEHPDSGVLHLERPIRDVVDVLDNLVELAVFTPRGSFAGDPDFGFEYWNYEYANVYCLEFNEGQKMINSEITRYECEESIRQSVLTYLPELKQVAVSMELHPLSSPVQKSMRPYSRYEVVVSVSAELNDGLGTMRPYHKSVRFLMEPVAKASTY